MTDAIDRAWNDLPAQLRAHPGIKALHRAALSAPQPAAAQAEPQPVAEPLKGWKFNHVQRGEEDGTAEIGYLDLESDWFAAILTVDTGLYYQPEQALPLAVAILGMLQYVGTRPAKTAQPPARVAPQTLRVEVRECPDCGHIDVTEANDHHRVTPQGRAMGKSAARLAELGRQRLEKMGLDGVKGGNLRGEMCKTCACQLGSVPNGCLQTQLDFLKAAAEGKPFLCHAPLDGKICAGWVRARAELVARPLPLQALALLAKHEYSAPDSEDAPA